MSQKRRIILGIVVVAALTISYMIGRHGSKASSSSAAVRHVLYYLDPMHPSYKSDKPGIAPDCGMKLEPVYAEDVARFSAAGVAPTTLPAGAVSVDRGMQKLLGIRLASVEKGSSRNTVEVVGRVVPEDKSVYKLNSGVDGFIQDTFDDSVGTRVKKDQKLASYYSPEFLAVASGFLAASERVPGSVGTDGNRTVPYPGTVSKQGVSSIQGYTDRLRNLGMSEVQIRHIAESRQLPENIDVVSPVNGFILARNINAGQHFEHDMEFYRIADLSRVWVLAEMGEQEAAHLHPGGPATIALSGIGRELSAKITDSLPQSEVGGGTVKLRLEVSNPGFILRPDMLVDVKIPVRLPAGITIPVDALVDSGSQARVYVERSEGVFEPREVEVGWRSGERVEIVKGLHAGERVVAAATFLVDSESRLKALPTEGGMVPSGAPIQITAGSDASSTGMAKDPSCGKHVNRTKAETSGNTASFHGETFYFCSPQCKEKFQNGLAASASGSHPQHGS